MNNVAGVLFDGNNKIVFYNTNGIDLIENEYVVLQTERGLEVALLVFSNIQNRKVTSEMPLIVRMANEYDVRNFNKNKIDAERALEKAKKLASKLNLSMKFISASYTLDRNQLLFNFFADNRVDFRELAKELASIYKTRIELRQIGIRDKAKEISGIGQCGRTLCCSTFLKDLDSVSINMAKNQNISLSPSKINGQCGRLLCCLNYEDDVYTEYRDVMPNIGDDIDTEKGIGKVISVDPLSRTYVVNVPDVGRITINLEKTINE